jgi:hypothetical protein
MLWLAQAFLAVRLVEAQTPVSPTLKHRICIFPHHNNINYLEESAQELHECLKQT